MSGDAPLPYRKCPVEELRTEILHLFDRPPWFDRHLGEGHLIGQNGWAQPFSLILDLTSC